MNRILIFVTAFMLLALMISCGSDTGDSGNTGNTGDTDDTDMDLHDTGNTADDSDADTGNTGNTGDTSYTDNTMQWGSSENDVGYSVAVDSSGGIFVAGYTRGALDADTNAGSEDIFLTKRNSNGSEAWIKQWGSESQELGFSVAVDSSGGIFVAGYTTGSLDGNTNAGEWDSFLTKFNGDGSKAWTKQWGTIGEDQVFSIAVDSSGNIFVAGYTTGVFDGNTSAGYSDAFLTKFNSDGSEAWTKQWGTSGDDWGGDIVIDSSGNVYVTNHTDGDFDGYTNAGGWDIFLTKFNSDGIKAWTKQWGSSEIDSGVSLAVDSSDNIFVAGISEGDLDGNINAGGSDVFLTKFNSDGSKAWTKLWGTNEYEVGYSLALDSSGNILVAGYTDGGLDGNTNSGGSDVFLTKFNSNGIKAWTKQWGTSEKDEGYSVAVDSSDNIYVAGYTEGSLDVSAGKGDIFLTIFMVDGQ